MRKMNSLHLSIVFVTRRLVRLGMRRASGFSRFLLSENGMFSSAGRVGRRRRSSSRSRRGGGGEKEKRRKRRRRKLNSVCRLGRAANSAQTQLQKRYTFFLFSVPTTISDPTKPRSCSDLPMESLKVRSRLISRTEPIIVQDQSGSLNRWVALK